MIGLDFLFVLKSLVFLGTLTFILTLFGSKLGRLLNISLSFLPKLALGFITNLALVQFIGWPFIAFRWSNQIFRIIVLLLLTAELIWSRKEFKLSLPSKNCLYVVIPLLLVIILTFCFYRSDADDSFYVSNVTLFQNSSVLNLYDSSFGIPTLGTVPMYDFQTWEAWCAVFAWILNMNGASLMHTVLLPFLLLVSAGSYLFLGKILFPKNDTHAKLFYALQILFSLMGGYAVYSSGSFLLSRLWQGKAVYLHVVLPFVTAVILHSIKKNQKHLSLILLSCLLTGMALNPTSLYIVGFQIIFMMIAIAITKKSWKILFSLIPTAAIGIFFTLMIYIRTNQFSGQIEAASQISASFVKTQFLNFWGSGLTYFFLFLISTLFVLFWGSQEAKVYFIIVPLLMLLFIWNPWSGSFIAKYVTKAPSYWRVFWLIPAAPGISYVILLIKDKFKIPFLKYGLFFLGIICLILPGRWMFSHDNSFIQSNNIQKVPAEVLDFSHIFLSEEDSPVILGCYEFSTTLRQVYSQPELVYSRDQYILDLFQYRGKPEEASDRFVMLRFANNLSDESAQVIDLLKEYKVDYIILSNDHPQQFLLQENGWKLKTQSSKYVLYEHIY